MSELKKTSRDLNHYHIVYIGDDSNVVVLESAGHTHNAILGDQGVAIEPGGKNGHTHEILKVYPTKKDKSENDEDIVNSVHEQFKTYYEYSQDSFEKGDESYDFYANEQWGEDYKQRFNKDSKACLPINDIQKHVDTLLC